MGNYAIFVQFQWINRVIVQLHNQTSKSVQDAQI